MNDLDRSTWLTDGFTWARCDNDSTCGWKVGRGGSAAATAAKARKHTRETGHQTRVFDQRVTLYKREGGTP